MERRARVEGVREGGGSNVKGRTQGRVERKDEVSVA